MELQAGIAIYRDDVPALEALGDAVNFNHFVTIGDTEMSFLGLAIAEGKNNVLRFLLDRPEVDVLCVGRRDLNRQEVNAFLLCMSDVIQNEHSRAVVEEQLEILMFHPRLDVNLAPVGTDEAPIHRAAILQNPFFLEVLLRHPEIDVNVRSRGGYSPLSIAAMGEYNEHVDLLLAHPTTRLTPLPDAQERPAIFDVTDYGTSLLIYKTLAAGGNPNAEGFHEGLNIQVNLFEFNILLCAAADGEDEVKDRVKAGHIIFDFGGRPNVRAQVREEVGRRELTEEHRDAVNSLLNLSSKRITLAWAARAALFSHIRIMTEPVVTGNIVRNLVESESLPPCVKHYISKP